jgi:hypothetical protein
MASKVPDAEGPLAPLGRYFAELAAGEASSVVAFRLLREELARHGAPAHLLRAATRAQADERRHARVMRTLARRFGGHPRPPRIALCRAPELKEMLAENVAEACVRETLGALTALWQSRRARDPGIRRAMMGIARDETRHALLGWRVADWGDRLIDKGGRAAVDAAKRAAIETLRREVAARPAPCMQALAGVPSGSEALALVSVAETSLWS